MSFFWLTGGVVDDQSNTAIIYRLSNYLPTPIAERYIIAFLSPFDRVKDDQKTIERRWKDDKTGYQDGISLEIITLPTRFLIPHVL